MRVVPPVLLILAFAAGCAAGITHRVGPGENLFRIGKAYGIPYRRLGRINRIYSPYRLKQGQKLFIPRASRQLPVTVITPRAADPSRPAGRAPRAPTGLSWPASGRITSGFGPRREGHHDGIDLAAAEGSAVRAAAAGKVIFSDRLSGYGNVVIVEHGGGLTTVYAHNARNHVAKGDRVAHRQQIASLGSTGRTAGPHLHFEVRKDNVVRNPVFYLPKR